MKAMLIRLFMPPVVFLLPWLMPALTGQRLRFILLFTSWAIGVVVMLRLWAGPGLILLVVIGLFAIITTRIKVTA